nr:hypothetical protein [Prevotella sp.]
MKKIMISLMMVVAATTSSFAKSNNTDVANAVKSIAEQVKQAPSGTVYGVVENTKHHIIVATPFGKYTIAKKDGGVSFMGISAKLVSAKNGVYQVKSSLGNFSVNTRKGTITKK